MISGALYSQAVTASGASPDQWAVFMHGLFGQGDDLRAVAARFVEQRPDWGVHLVDLRLHGQSVGFSPPHTIESCSEDVRRFMKDMSGPPVRALLGLSLSGKIALMIAASPPEGLQQVWTIDSRPGPTNIQGEAWRILSALQAMDTTFADLGEAIRQLTKKGFTMARAQWLARNLIQGEAGFSWQWAVDEMLALRSDYVRRDLWSVIEASRQGVGDVHIIRADQSKIIDEPSLRRIERAAQTNHNIHLHRLTGRHSLHRKNPAGIAALLAEGLPKG